jgi:16S rRNA (adenine1518-N6/adenine1519-N6)-dimethyltransferase
MKLPALDVPRLLKRYGLHPDKRLGQNFLVDTSALQQVVDTAELTSQDIVLEVGPGLGSLTRLLAQHAQQVIAVELDLSLIPVLEEVLSQYDNVVLVHGDILKIDLDHLFTGSDPALSYSVVANIPYYITSALIRHLLEAHQRPSRVVLTVQREVAERIIAVPNDMNLLAISVQVYGEAKLAGNIPGGSFYPPPQVDSAIVRIDLYEKSLFSASVVENLFRLAKAGFSQKRKTLRNSISAGLRYSPQEAANLLQSAGIQPNRRAETVSLEEWAKLAEIDLQHLPPAH